MARTQQKKKQTTAAVAKTPIAKKTTKATVTTTKKKSKAIAKAVATKTVDTNKFARLDAVTQQSLKAATSLLAYVEKVNEKKNSSMMIEDAADAVFLSVGLARVPDNAFKSFKGKRIAVPHSVYPIIEDEEEEICLLVKDKKEAKAWLEKQNVTCVAKVIELAELRTKYSNFTDKRDLAARYPYFVADDRIVCMLPKTLGRAFYSGQNRPLPIRLAQRSGPGAGIQQRIQQAIKQSAFYYIGGNCTVVRVGHTSQSAQEVSENVAAVVKCLAHSQGENRPSMVPRGWTGIQSLHIKTGKSVALPVYAHLNPAATLKSLNVVADAAAGDVAGKKSKVVEDKKTSKKSSVKVEDKKRKR